MSCGWDFISFLLQAIFSGAAGLTAPGSVCSRHHLSIIEGDAQLVILISVIVAYRNARIETYIYVVDVHSGSYTMIVTTVLWV